jgi:hypothetical protein
VEVWAPNPPNPPDAGGADDAGVIPNPPGPEAAGAEPREAPKVRPLDVAGGALDVVGALEAENENVLGAAAAAAGAPNAVENVVGAAVGAGLKENAEAWAGGAVDAPKPKPTRRRRAT